MIEQTNEPEEMFAFGDTIWPGLAKIVEEAGELLRIAGKVMMRHGATDYWDIVDLRKAFLEELADLDAALMFQEMMCMTTEERIVYIMRRNEKLSKFKHWHQDGHDPIK